jgi:CRP-like cAMP-binding protein
VAEPDELEWATKALASTHLLDMLRESSLRDLAATCRRVTLEAGTVLLRQGEPGGCLYFVVWGQLTATAREPDGEVTLLGEAHEGEFVGEGALLDGAPHMATVTATTDVVLLELSPDGLHAFLTRDETVREGIREMLDHRLDWARRRRLRPSGDELVDLLAHHLGGLEPAVQAAVADELRWVTLPRGATLLRQGEHGDSAYLVVSGRLRVFGERDDGVVEIAEVGSGEAVGEMALLSNEPRAASVEALRDTELLALSRTGFERLVGEDAKALRFFTRLLVTRLDRSIRSRAPVAQLGVRSTVTLADCDEVVMTDDLVLRNLKITQMYHRLSQELTLILGHADANWCTFACSASKTAGYSIRGEVAGTPAWLSLRRTGGRAAARRGTLAARLERIQQIVTERVSAGNLKVFAELAPIFAEMIRAFQHDEHYDREKLTRFLTRFDRGPTEAGGQDTLAEALTHYYEAMFERSPKRKAELVLLGNIKVGLHEQIRLQPNIVAALNAPLVVGLDDPFVQRVTTRLVRLAPDSVEAALRRRGGALERALLGSTAGTWRRLVTRSVMTIKLPYGELRLGDEVPELPTDVLFPDVLQVLELPELVRVVARYAGSAEGMSRPAADWGVLDDRMRFIVTLFRSRQRSLELFTQPFLYEQLLEIVADRVPAGEL